MRETALDALVCALPKHVLLLSGYWPVIGISIVVFTREGHITLLVPEDEIQFAEQGWADQIQRFRATTLDELPSGYEQVHTLARLVISSVKAASRIGYEFGPSSQAVTYSAMHWFGASLGQSLQDSAPNITCLPADESLSRLAAVKTAKEIGVIRRACYIAEDAFVSGAERLRPGLTEVGAADLFRSGFSLPEDNSGEQRAGGFAFCMSGPNAAKAAGAFAKSRDRAIGLGDFVLMHANSYCNGFWSDVTRTYLMGEPNDRQSRMYEAVLAARKAVLDSIRPGARACDVDAAARETLKRFGFSKEFKHPTGHGVGFEAISPTALPQIHPKSEQKLEAGMVFNVEPAIYIEGFGGLRHCDVVAVTQHGVELLTPFQAEYEELIRLKPAA